MGCTDLSIWGLIKVAYQVGGKIVNDSVNGVWIIIWGQNLHDSLHRASVLYSAQRYLHFLTYMHVYSMGIICDQLPW